MQPHCSYRISTADPPLFDWPSITVNVRPRSVTPTHLMGSQDWVSGGWVSHQITHFYSMVSDQCQQPLWVKTLPDLSVVILESSVKGPVSQAQPSLICRPTNIHLFAWNMVHTHTHTKINAFVCTQNNAFQHDLTFDSRLQGTSTQNCLARASDSSLSPLIRALSLCVSMCGEWCNGRHRWTAVLITSSNAEITTVPAEH